MLLGRSVLKSRFIQQYSGVVVDRSAIVSAVGQVSIATSEHALFASDAVSCAPPGASAGLSPDPTGSASSAWSPAPNHPDTSLVVCGPDMPRTPGTSAQPLGCLPLWPSGCATPNEESTFAPCDEALLPPRLPHPRPRRHPALRRTQQRLVDITTHSTFARTGARSWRRTRAMVLQRDGHQCVIRGPHCGISAVEVDHVQPVSEGGSDDPDNCQSSCGPCHAAKTASEAAHGRNRWKRHPADYLSGGPEGRPL